jgi:hypothetical protein
VEKSGDGKGASVEIIFSTGAGIRLNYGRAMSFNTSARMSWGASTDDKRRGFTGAGIGLMDGRYLSMSLRPVHRWSILDLILRIS